MKAAGYFALATTRIHYHVIQKRESVFASPGSLDIPATVLLGRIYATQRLLTVTGRITKHSASVRKGSPTTDTAA